VRPRLTDSVETALKEGKGILIVTDEHCAKASDRTMSELNACTLAPLPPLSHVGAAGRRAGRTDLATRTIPGDGCRGRRRLG